MHIDGEHAQSIPNGLGLSSQTFSAVCGSLLVSHATHLPPALAPLLVLLMSMLTCRPCQCSRAADVNVDVQAISEVCAVCNESKIEYKAGNFRAVGAPTEAALLVSKVATCACVRTGGLQVRLFRPA